MKIPRLKKVIIVGVDTMGMKTETKLPLEAPMKEGSSTQEKENTKAAEKSSL